MSAVGRAERDRITRNRLARQVRTALAGGHLFVIAGAGWGKTTALEDALSDAPGAAAWVSCADTEWSAGMLLLAIVGAIAAAVPGATDALVDRLRGATEQVDPQAAIDELIRELSLLLVEPVALIVDDAERLAGNRDSLGLIGRLIRPDKSAVRVAILSRRPLDLPLAKARAGGRLTELTAADLAFDAEDCAALVRSRARRDPAPEQVDAIMQSTQGWPIGVTVAATAIGRALRHGGAPDLEAIGSAPDLRAYLNEELIGSLEPDLRRAVIRSSIAPVVTPAIARALDLPADLEAGVARAGLPTRADADSSGFAYHPLVREFLVERLAAEVDDRRSLHAAVASALAESGDGVGAIDHWLQAQRWGDAARAIEEQGLVLARTSPPLVHDWIAALPEAERARPGIRALEGQMQWIDGDHEEGIRTLRDAVRGFRDQPNAPAEWVARSILADLLFSSGRVDEIPAVVHGWDDPAAADAFDLAPAAAMFGAVTLAALGRVDESDKLAAEVRSCSDSPLLPPLEPLRRMFIDLPAGHIDEVCEGLERSTRALERFDPLNRLSTIVGARALALGERGDPEEALALWRELRAITRGGVVPLATDATHAWCALLHAQAGRLPEAEAELAQHRQRETGMRAYAGDVARAAVAALRGDAPGTAAAADAALATVGQAHGLFRYGASAGVVVPLATVGLVDRAAAVLAETLAVVDEDYPGARGSFLRGRLLGLRAWLHDLRGDVAASDDDLRALFAAGGDGLRHILRRDWPRLQPLVSDALARGVLAPEPTIVAVAAAFPGGLELVDFLDHAVPEVRREALGPAMRSGDPRAVARVVHLSEDGDAGLAQAASRAARAAAALPPLRVEVLGGCTLRRGAWRVAEADWARPIDARLLRFLVIHLGTPVPEDDVLEALWPDLPVQSAHRSLQVAASRVRRLVDLPGTETSVIERVDQAYRLALGPGARVDADEFRSAARLALSAEGDERAALLEHARSLWGGEPLPEERYSDWAAGYREGLIDRFTAVMTALVDLHERAGDHLQAAETARDLIELDPLNEGAHRALITAYARAGRTGMALRQYLECRRRIVDALGIEPAAATSRLQARILAGEPV